MRKKLLSILLLVLVPLFNDVAQADFMGAKGKRLQVNQSYIEGSFEIKQNTTFTLYFTTDYTADLILINSSSAQSFVNGGAVSYYDGFNGNFGLKNITLGPGSYSLGVRNRSNSENTVSYELELWPPDSSTGSYNDTYFTEATYVSANGKLWQPFTVQSGFSYIVEGCNTGLDFYVIPASALSNFTGNRTFSHFPEYGAQSDPNQPGLTKLNLAPGDYYLAFNNPNSERKALVYAMYRYRDSGSGGGTGSGTSTGSNLSLEGSVSYQTSGSSLTLNADRIINSGSGASGTLQLSLWATTSKYGGGELNGYKMAESTLSALNGGYQYTSVQRIASFTPPPSGRQYYVTLVLAEYRSNAYVIVDYRNFDNLYGSSTVPASTSVAEINLQTGQLNFAVNGGSSGLLYLKNSLFSQSPNYVFRVDEVTGWSGTTSGVASFSGGVVTIPLLRVTGSSATYSNVRLALSQQAGVYYLTLLSVN